MFVQWQRRATSRGFHSKIWLKSLGNCLVARGNSCEKFSLIKLRRIEAKCCEGRDLFSDFSMAKGSGNVIKDCVCTTHPLSFEPLQPFHP